MILTFYKLITTMLVNTSYNFFNIHFVQTRQSESAIAVKLNHANAEVVQ